jgi:alcohol dehydrogenase class IV
MSQTTLAGGGILAKVPAVIAEQRPEAREIVLLTFGTGESMPAVTELIASLRARFPNVVHQAFSTPRLEVLDIDRVEGSLRAAGIVHPDVLISIGGGSVMDLMKLLKQRFDLKPGERESCFHVAVPTTAGTGSEATCIAVVYDNGVKQSIESPELLPDVAVLDPKLLEALPRKVMIPPLLDALSQAIEALWSVRSTPQSDQFASEAIRRIVRGIDEGVWLADPITMAGGTERVAEPGHQWPLEALLNLQWGANFSGRAIQISRTTLAHALSYPLTARWGVPHGLAVFVNLPRVAHFNAEITASDCVDSRGPEFVRKRVRLIAKLLCEAEEVDAASIEAQSIDPLARITNKLKAIARKVGVSLELRDYGPKSEEELRSILSEALGSPRSGNNPRRPSIPALWPYFQSAHDFYGA